MAQTVKSLPAARETQVQSLGQEDSPGKGHGYPLQYPCLENPMGRGPRGLQSMEVAKSQTRLSRFTLRRQKWGG